MKMNRFEYFLMTFDFGRQIYLKNIVNKLKELSKLDAGKKILEIGCGNGSGSFLINKIFQPAAFIATEYDERLVEIARQINKGKDIFVEQGNAASLQFSDNTFDAVIGLSVIHHIPNWEECIDELHRVIKPNGLLILKELSIDTFESPIGKIARHLVEHPYEDMFRKLEFLDYLNKKGFGLIRNEPHRMPMFMEDFFIVARKELQ